MLKKTLKTSLIATVALSTLGMAGALITATPAHAATTAGEVVTSSNSDAAVQTTTEAQKYGELVTINDQTIRQNHAEELTTPVIANPTTAGSSQDGMNLAVVPAGIKTSWAAPQQLMADVAQPGNHQEGVVVAFPDGSTKTLGMALHVLGDEQNTNQTKQSQLMPSNRADLESASNGPVAAQFNGQGKTSSELESRAMSLVTDSANPQLVTERVPADNNQLPQTGVDQEKGLLSLGLATAMTMLGLIRTNRQAGKR